MKIAIISDIHGNFPALENTLEYIKGLDVEEIYCLGDIVGYGAQPNECCDLIRETTDKIIIGNHDAAACGILDFSWFNPVAKHSLQWTSETLTKDNIEWLKSLPYSISKDDLIFSHALLYKLDEFYYDDELIPIYYSFKEMGEKYKVSLIGHSHKYNILRADSTDKLKEWTQDGNIELDKENKYIINAGSVGQPRDKNPDSCFIVYTNEEKNRSVYVHRVKYDIDKSAEMIIKNNLPAILAERLFLGI